ncbi:MAG: DEAD/DEAH box helicase [Burkholderiaceae bacterium]
MTSAITFADLGLAEPLLRAVADTGYTHPTPIQAQAIPQVIKGGDLLAAAQTGTGKTAGFTLPILHRLLTLPAPAPKAGRPRVLILTPTRELTAQVEESVRTYGQHTRVRSMVMFGGVNINPQISALRKPIDILVATPGRLLDHAQQKTVDLSGVEILVLDEADRMLDMGFIRDIRRILALLPKQRQNLLFSATFSDEIRELAKGVLSNPAEISVARRNTASELVDQRVVITEQNHKRDLLSHIIRESGWHQVLVFTRTKHGANRLAEKLSKDGLSAAAIHGNKSQAARTRALAGFKDGKVSVLVATDIAARGIDIDQLPQVVNFELPNVPEDYVHRIGRTGRAGSEGSALSLVDRSEVKLLSAIEKLIKRPIDRITIDGWSPSMVQAETPAPRPAPAARAPRPHRAANAGAPRRQGHAPGAGKPQRARPAGNGQRVALLGK